MRIENILLIILLLAIAVICTTFVISYKKIKEAELNIAKYEINTRSTIDASIPAVLNLIIEDCFNDYQVMILAPKDELYISDDREREIRSDLVNKVTERLSTEAVQKLSQFYNIKNIGNIIADKIYITVMNYVVTHNSIIMSESAKNKGVSD